MRKHLREEKEEMRKRVNALVKLFFKPQFRDREWTVNKLCRETGWSYQVVYRTIQRLKLIEKSTSLALVDCVGSSGIAFKVEYFGETKKKPISNFFKTESKFTTNNKKFSTFYPQTTRDLSTSYTQPYPQEELSDVNQLALKSANIDAEQQYNNSNNIYKRGIYKGGQMSQCQSASWWAALLTPITSLWYKFLHWIRGKYGL